MTARGSFSYRSKGFVVELTLEAESGKDLLAALGAAQDHLLGAGATPVDPFAAPTAAVVAANLAGQNGAGDGQGADWCTIHACSMSQHTGEGGQTWYSHKTADGWCRGKAKKGKE